MAGGAVRIPFFFLVAGVVAAAVGATLLSAGSLTTVVGWSFLAVGVAFVALVLPQLLARSAFNHVELTALAPVCLGGQVELVLVLEARRELTLGPGSKATLRCIEEATYRNGSDSRTYTQVLHEEGQSLSLPRQLRPGERAEARVTFTVPRHVAPSWRGHSNAFKSVVDAEVDIEGWPDLTVHGVVKVLPQLA